MKKIKLLITILFALLLFGCGSDEENIKESYKVHLYIDEIIKDKIDIQTEYSVFEGETFIFPVLESDIFYYSQIENISVESHNYKYKGFANEFEFLGWADEYGTVTSSSTIINSDKEFTLVFDYIEHYNVIYFYTNGGTIDNDSFNDPNESKKLSLPSITKENYTFLGWYPNSKFSGSPIKEYTLNFNNTNTNLYAKFCPNVSYVQGLIDDIPEEITIFDIEKVENARNLYYELDKSMINEIKGFERINDLYKKLDIYREAYNIYDKIERIYSIDINANLKNKLLFLIDEINALGENVKSLIPNLDLDRLNEILSEVNELYELFKEESIAFDKKIAKLPIYLEKYYINEINKIYNEYLSLDDNVRNILYCENKLISLYENANEIQKQKHIYYLNTTNTKNVYESKKQLFEAFFIDFYYYIVAFHGVDHLENNNLYDVSDFVNLAGDFYGAGASNLYGIGNIAGRYMLEKDVNGILQNQTENGFFGFCYQNELYQDILPFFINFFAYWRIDEKYANTSNYGADIFAESWAPTVDIAKFFYYNENTSPVKTERMIDCMTNVAGVVYNMSNNPTLRGYIFKGWYDNPEFNGSTINDIYTTSSKELYAKWEIDNNQVNKDKANMVDIYIYNLTTSKAVVTKTTIQYVFDMYNSLSESAKALVTKYDILLEIDKSIEQNDFKIA